MILGTVFWIILCGTPFFAGCFLLILTVFRLTRATLCIGEVCDIELSDMARATTATFHLITEYEGKKIELEPLTTLTLFPFFKKTQLKRLKRKYM